MVAWPGGGGSRVDLSGTHLDVLNICKLYGTLSKSYVGTPCEFPKASLIILLFYHI